MFWLRPFYLIHIRCDMCGQLGIPQCISTWSAAAAAVLETLFFTVKMFKRFTRACLRTASGERPTLCSLFWLLGTAVCGVVAITTRRQQQKHSQLLQQRWAEFKPCRGKGTSLTDGHRTDIPPRLDSMKQMMVIRLQKFSFCVENSFADGYTTGGDWWR